MTSNKNRTDDRSRVAAEAATEPIHSEHDWSSGDPLYFTVIRAVSAVTGQEPTVMEPLYSAVDPEAIEALIDPSREGAIHLSFSYEGCAVSIESSGEVVVQSEE